MKGRPLIRLAIFFVLTALLAATVSPLLAQEAPALTQSAQVDDNGLTLSIAYPAAWVEKQDGNRLMLATSQAALDALNTSGVVSSPGDVGIVIYMPSALASLNLDTSAAPDKVVAGYLQMGKVEGDVAIRTDLQVPAATSLIAIPAQTDEKGLVGAMRFPGGTIIFGAVPGDAQQDVVLAIIKSLTLTGGQPALATSAPANTPNAALPQTAQVSANSQTLSISYPDGWVSQATSESVEIASNAAALDELNTKASVSAAGAVGIIASHPVFLDRLGLPENIDPAHALTTYQHLFVLKGDVQASSDYPVPAATAQFTSPTGAPITSVALQFPGGTVIVDIFRDGTSSADIQAIINSLTLTSGGAVTPEATPEAAAPVAVALSDTPTTFDVPQRSGLSAQFAINLPEGWVNHYTQDAGLLYIGNSQAVVDKITSSDAGLQAGQVGMTIVMPDELGKVGITQTDTPEDVIQGFENAFKGSGKIFTDSSFVVPAAYASVAGDNVPAGGGVALALAFDSGTILVVIQPANAIDDSIVSVLHSIRLTTASQSTTAATAEPQPTQAPTAAPAAQALHQWASSAEGSSEYGESDWSFAQATGKPDTAECGDNGTAWASKSSTGREMLRLHFDHPVIPSQINIYESFNPGAIVEVDLGSSANPDKELPLPKSADSSGATGCPGVFSLNVSGVDTPIDFVVLYIDQSITQNWNEIDAVELVGTPAS